MQTFKNKQLILRESRSVTSNHDPAYLDKKNKVINLLRFALSKKFTIEYNGLILSSDGQIYNIYTNEVSDGTLEYMNMDDLISNTILDLGTVYGAMYNCNSNISVLLAFATTINHNIRVLGVNVGDIIRYIDIDELFHGSKTYPDKLVSKLVYHLAITKNHVSEGMGKASCIDIGEHYVTNEINEVDVMGISPFEGLTIDIDTNSLKVYIVYKGRDFLLIDATIRNGVRMSLNVWNLYKDSDHSVGRLVKTELEKIGLLDLYLQRP